MLLLLGYPIVFVLCYAYSADMLSSALIGLAGSSLLAAGVALLRRQHRGMAAAFGAAAHLDWATAEPPVCPRCQNTGMYWAAMTNRCTADHRIGSRCWMCGDSGAVTRHQPVACLHLSAVSAA